MGILQKLKDRLLKIQTLRRIVQFISFLLIYSIIFGISPIPLLLPVLTSMGTRSKIVGEAFATFQYMLYEKTFPWLPIAAFLLFAIFFGRALCGWVCPFGFIQDLMAYVKRRHKEVSLDTHRSFIKIKYFLLGIILFISFTVAISLVTSPSVGERYTNALGPFSETPFNVLSPSDTMFAVLPNMFLSLRFAIYEQSFWQIVSGIAYFSPLLWARLIIFFAVMILAAYIPRGWCKYFCPNGALMALFSRFSFLGLKRELIKCTRAECRICVEACPMKVRITELPWEKISDPECIYCLKCVDACPTKALKPKFP